MNVKDLETLLLTQRPAAEKIARQLDRKTVLNLCRTSKKINQSEFCQKEFWFNLLNHDLAKYKHYYWIYHQLVGFQLPRNLNIAITRYYDYRDFWRKRETYLKNNLNNLDTRRPYAGSGLFNSDALDLLYLILLNDLPYNNQSKVALLYQYILPFDLASYRKGEEWAPYWFALWALYAERNNDQEFLESLLSLEDFWSKETLAIICSMPDFSQKIKKSLFNREIFIMNNIEAVE